MKHFFRVNFILILLFSLYQVGYSCTCKAPSQRKTFEKAKAVFVGQVAEIKQSNDKTVADLLGMSKVYDIKFKVEKSWKGNKNREITVVSDNGHLGCDGYPFKIGEKYLVYAKGENLVIVGNCERTVPIAASSDDIKNLNNSGFRFVSRLLPF